MTQTHATRPDGVVRRLHHTHRIHRLLGVTFLAVLTLSLSSMAATLGCGTNTQHSGFSTTGGFGDSGPNEDDGGFGGADSAMPPPSIQGLTGITISPTMTSLSLQYPVTGSGATTTLKATGTFQSGPTQEVTAAVSWAIAPAGTSANIGVGAFSSTAPGAFSITASAVSSGMTITSNTATVTVTLSGTVIGTGITQGDLDGTPSGGAPTIAYPLNGSLFPYQLGPIEFQVVPTDATQTEARIAFEGDNIDLKVYEPCVAIAMPTMPNACTITVPAELETQLDGASEGTMLTETVRLAAPGGGSLAESMPISARWSSFQLNGGLYYWSALLNGGTTTIMRFDLDTPGTAALQYFTNVGANGMNSDEQNMDLPASMNSTTCFGCHAISLDGTKMGLTFGGSQPSNFALIDVATKKSIATRLFPTDPNMGTQPFAAFTAYSKDGTVMMQSVGGKLMLRTADANLTTLSSDLFATTINESATTPFWSPKGDLLAFTGWVPDAAMATTLAPAGGDPDNTNGDETLDAEIWITTVTGDMTFGTPTLLVPRDSTMQHTEHYPVISDDDLFVAFNESSCNGPAAPNGETGYGASPCDGYDDPSATLRMVSAKGGQPVYLTNASNNGTWSSSWPRFAPSHGTFQGKNLYWIAFSSRFPYGATLAGTNNPAGTNTEPQLWFSAVVVDPSGTLSGDPSFAPVWMPQQNPAGMQRGNHTPQWVTKAVTVVD